LLDVSREAIAKVLNADVDGVVFVPNATTGVNTALRNIVWNEDGKDEILYFETIYGACGNTIEYVCEANRYLVHSRMINVTYPIEDSDLLSLFKDAIKASRAAGKTPRLALYDSVSSIPGLRMPFEDLTKICKEEGILSLIDGAHGVGHLQLNLTTLDPDFFVSNAHKWLSVPRGCAVFYVPKRNQHLIRSTLPTSHGFVPTSEEKKVPNPLPPNSKSEFVNNFEFIGTIDNTNYLVVADSIAWREKVCGGEDAIISYSTNLAKEGGKAVAKILGTAVMDNSTETLTNCCLVNVRLPLTVSDVKVTGTNTLTDENGTEANEWMLNTLMEEYKTFIPIYSFQGQWWARLSGQIYLDMEDFEWAGVVLKELCERVGNDEFLTAKSKL
jgi:hercynylcysteine S-oxide lyase